MKKRAISLILAVLILICCMSPALAATSETTLEEVVSQISGRYLRPYTLPVYQQTIRETGTTTAGVICFDMKIEEAQYKIKVGGSYYSGMFDRYDAQENHLISETEGCTVIVGLDSALQPSYITLTDSRTYKDRILFIDRNAVVNIENHVLWDKEYSHNLDGTYIFTEEEIVGSPGIGGIYPSYLPEKNRTPIAQESIKMTINGPYYTFEFEADGEMKTLTGFVNRYTTVFTGYLYQDGVEGAKEVATEEFYVNVSDWRWGYPGLLRVYFTHYDDDRNFYGFRSTTQAMNMVKVKEPSEPEPREYNVNIMGYGTSVTGEYMVNIMGTIQGTFIEGANTLSFEDVQSQNLSITTFNLTNGASRLMDINTVEGIQVTVTGGAVTNVAVTGRAQTNPGNFDRYTVNCNIF